MSLPPLIIQQIEVIPARLPLKEPFVIAYASYPDMPTVIIRVTTTDGLVGWGEAVPDPYVTGETYTSTLAMLRDDLAPAFIGFDARDREMAVAKMDALVWSAPAAKAAIDIALHDLVARAAGIPLWALLGGRSKPHLEISRVVSIKSPEAMAEDARRLVSEGYPTVKLKVGDALRWRLDVQRMLTVRVAVGPDIAIKVDVNQGWKTPGIAIQAIRAAEAANAQYIEQPVEMGDIAGLAEVRRQTGAIIMADECCHGPHEMQQIVQLRAADLVNIKLMKTGGIVNALKVNAIAESAGIAAQIGTMVESSIASAAGLHTAMAMRNVKTVEMGGPKMVTSEIGDVGTWYHQNHVTVPDDKPGLGVTIDEAALKAFSEGWFTVR